jgi:outer membrane biosynthesis protein TonB
MNSSKKNKSKAWIGTLLFHTLLIILFLFTGLSYTIPAPPEKGMNINFGITDLGKGKVETSTEEIEEIINEPTSENNPATEDITTQETVKTIETKKKEDKKKSEILLENKKKVEEKKEEVKKIIKKAIFKPNKNKGNDGNDGNTNGEGNMGEIDGDPNSDGKGFGNGLSEIGNSRSKPKDLYHPLEMGKGYITVNIIVNAEGKITDIDDSSFYTTLGNLGKTKRENLYTAIKRDLKYGPETGPDKSDKLTKLKINFIN